jgi:uncharacterized BrkB/YihY/UPF0761 family membrane protein
VGCGGVYGVGCIGSQIETLRVFQQTIAHAWKMRQAELTSEDGTYSEWLKLIYWVLGWGCFVVLALYVYYLAEVAMCAVFYKFHCQSIAPR